MFNLYEFDVKLNTADTLRNQLCKFFLILYLNNIKHFDTGGMRDPLPEKKQCKFSVFSIWKTSHFMGKWKKYSRPEKG